MNHHPQIFQALALLDQARQREPVHFRPLQVGQRQRHLVVDGLALGIGLPRDRMQCALPKIITRSGRLTLASGGCC
jgi:hypothetical protein